MNSNHQIGLQYYFGIDGKSRNYTLATDYFKKEASAATTTDESIYSMIMLSKCYLQGLGINEDEEQGLMWLVKAANSSCGLSTAYAKNDLGMLILNNIKTQNPNEVKSYCQSLQSDSEVELGSTPINLNDIHEKEQKDRGERTNMDDDAGSEEDEDHYGVGDAIKLLIEAAAEGHVEAMTNLGQVYEEAGDLEQANHCYLQAIQSGCCKSAFLLGHLYLLQYSSNTNNNSSADNGHSLHKKGLLKYQQRAIVLLKTAVLNGELDAFHLLGQCYELGKGMSHPDTNQAIHYYRKGSKLGDKISMYHLGMLLIDQSIHKLKEKQNKQLLIQDSSTDSKNNNCDVESKEKDIQTQAKNDVEEGIRWLRTSSDLECKDAAYELGKLYEVGIAFDYTADLNAALCYYKWGAKLGHNECALFAANILYSKANTFSNIVLIFEASTLYYQAAISGLPAAMNSYGILLEDGLTNEDGVRYTEDAAAWYYQAAILGEHKSFFNLAALLANDDTFTILPSPFSEGGFITISEAKSTLSNYFNGKSFQGNDDERVKGLEIVDGIRDSDVKNKMSITMNNENLHSPMISKSSDSYSKKVNNSSYSPGSISNSKSIRHRSQSTTASLESGSIDSRKIPQKKKSLHKKKQIILTKEVENSTGDDISDTLGVQYTTNGFVYPPNYAPRVKAHTAPVSSNKPPTRNPILQEIMPPTLTSLNKKVQSSSDIHNTVVQLPINANITVPLPTKANNTMPFPTKDNDIVPFPIKANNTVILPTKNNNTVPLPIDSKSVNQTPIIDSKSKEELVVGELPVSPPPLNSVVIHQTVEIQSTNISEDQESSPSTVKLRKKPSFIFSMLRPFTARKHEMKYVGPYKKQNNTENQEQSSTVLSAKLKYKQLSKNSILMGSDNIQDQSISTCNDVGDPTSDISLSSKEFP